MAGMKVYVVSCQQLFANSFSIEGVYSSRAAAEWAIKNDPNVVGDVIEEFELKGDVRQECDIEPGQTVKADDVVTVIYGGMPRQARVIDPEIDINGFCRVQLLP